MNEISELSRSPEKGERASQALDGVNALINTKRNQRRSSPQRILLWKVEISTKNRVPLAMMLWFTRKFWLKQLPASSCWQITLGSERDLFPSAGLYSPSPTKKKKMLWSLIRCWVSPGISEEDKGSLYLMRIVALITDDHSKFRLKL